MSERRDDLIDEAILRRALRLDQDERGPRFDAAAIVALAESGPARRAIAIAAGATVLMGLIGAAVWSALGDAAPTLIDDVVGLAVPVVVAILAFLAPIAQLAAEPAVPLSLLAALGIAILHELRERREYAHANAS